ncbi:MAG: hypothetical protein JXR96_13825 [Deltaproteobacteria bacterium]|nr:hypothetical protein [Deltaproteobacteria bacterium]
MKVQCPECKEIVPLEVFATSDAGLRFRCPDCGKVCFVPNAANLEAADAAAEQTARPEPAPIPPARASGPLQGVMQAVEGEVLCPKCGHAQRDARACHRCGLVFDKFDPAAMPPDPPGADEIWAKILEQPHDDALHQEFLRLCSDADRLDFASRHYTILSRAPGQQQRAEAMRERILHLAQAKLAPGGLVSDRSDDPKRTGKILMWVLLLIFTGVLAVFVYYSAEAWS